MQYPLTICALSSRTPRQVNDDFEIHLRRVSEQFPERNKQQKAFVSTCEEEFDPVQWTISKPE